MNSKPNKPSKSPLLCLGKESVTPAEYDALHTIGYGLFLIGRGLHVASTTGACAALADGYAAAGGIATKIRTADPDHEPTLVILDMVLEQKIKRRIPDWANKENWFVIENEETLLDAASMFLGVTAADTETSLVGGGGVVVDEVGTDV